MLSSTITDPTRDLQGDDGPETRTARLDDVRSAAWARREEADPLEGNDAESDWEEAEDEEGADPSIFDDPDQLDELDDLDEE